MNTGGNRKRTPDTWQVRKKTALQMKLLRHPRMKLASDLKFSPACGGDYTLGGACGAELTSGTK
jgi:hypothetical protein